MKLKVFSLLRYMEFSERLDKKILEIIEDIKECRILEDPKNDFFKFSIFPVHITVQDQRDYQKAQAIVDEKRKLLQKLSILKIVDIIKDTEAIDDYDSSFKIRIKNPTELENLYRKLKKSVSTNQGKTENNEVFKVDERKPEIEVGKLVSFNDGSIYYDNLKLEMRSQIKDLCRFFMENKGRMLTIDDIRDRIIRTSKRENTPFSTISKYVSELRKYLKEKYKRDVIYNQKNEGWTFDPDI